MRDAGTFQTTLPPVDEKDLALNARCEALLFAAGTPVTVRELARAIGAPVASIDAALAELACQLARRGVRLQCLDGHFSLVSAPAAGPEVARLLGAGKAERLSPAALETLAIVAYRGPITRGEVEAIRGVDSSGVMQTLAARGLIDATGHRTTVGTPVEFRVTTLFLRHFGLASLDDLPPLGDVDGQPVETIWEERQQANRLRASAARSAPEDRPA